jgi:hypothetical protein
MEGCRHGRRAADLIAQQRGYCWRSQVRGLDLSGQVVESALPPLANNSNTTKPTIAAAMVIFTSVFLGWRYDTGKQLSQRQRTC